MDKYLLHNECSIDSFYTDDIKWLKDVYNISKPGTIFDINIYGAKIVNSVFADGRKELNRADYPNLSDSQFRKPSAAFTWDVCHEIGELLGNTVKLNVSSSKPELKCIDEEYFRYFYPGKLNDNETENVITDLANVVEDSYKSVYSQLFNILTKALSDFDKKTAIKKQSQSRPANYYILYTDFRNGFMDDRYGEKITSLEEIQKIKPENVSWLMLDGDPVEDAQKLSTSGLAYMDVIRNRDDEEFVYVPVIKIRSYDSDNKAISGAVSYYYNTNSRKWVPRTEAKLPSGISKFADSRPYEILMSDSFNIESMSI